MPISLQNRIDDYGLGITWNQETPAQSFVYQHNQYWNRRFIFKQVFRTYLVHDKKIACKKTHNCQREWITQYQEDFTMTCDIQTSVLSKNWHLKFFRAMLWTDCDFIFYCQKLSFFWSIRLIPNTDNIYLRKTSSCIWQPFSLTTSWATI